MKENMSNVFIFSQFVYIEDDVKHNLWSRYAIHAMKICPDLLRCLYIHLFTISQGSLEFCMHLLTHISVWHSTRFRFHPPSNNHTHVIVPSRDAVWPHDDVRQRQCVRSIELSGRLWWTWASVSSRGKSLLPPPTLLSALHAQHMYKATWSK